MTYDTYGRVAKEHAYRESATGKTQILTTTYEYTPMERVSRIHVPDGEISVKQYDDSDRCMVSYTLDKQGNHSIFLLFAVIY